MLQFYSLLCILFSINSLPFMKMALYYVVKLLKLEKEIRVLFLSKSIKLYKTLGYISETNCSLLTDCFSFPQNVCFKCIFKIFKFVWQLICSFRCIVPLVNQMLSFIISNYVKMAVFLTVVKFKLLNCSQVIELKNKKNFYYIRSYDALNFMMFQHFQQEPENA